MLVKERSWSASQYGLYKNCQAAYVYRYNVSWKAWREEDEEVVQAYLLKKGFDSTQLYREAFTEGFESLLESRLVHGTECEPLDISELIFEKLRSHVPVEGHWEVLQNYAWEICEEIYGFYKSELFQSLLAEAEGNVFFLNRRDYFWLDTIKVWGVLNLAYYDSAGTLQLLLWNLPAHSEPSLYRELFAVLYVMRKYHLGHDLINVKNLSIKNGKPSVRDCRLSIEALMEYQDLILNSSIKMQTLRFGKSLHFEKLWTEKKKSCESCDFRSCCAVSSTTGDL